MRPCNIPGRRMSVAQVSFAVTLEVMMEVGWDLAICGERSALTEVTLAGANEDGVVRMNFDPGIKLSRIERVLEGSPGDFRGLETLSFEEGRTDECDPDKKCAASFDELAAGESSFIYLDGVFCGVCHGLL